MGMPERPARHQLLYREALRKWGIYLQLLVLFEEIGELQSAIGKLMRTYGPALPNLFRGKPAWEEVEAVAEEIADVVIMLEQLAEWLDIWDDVQTWRRIKLDRLEERLKEADEDAQASTNAHTPRP